MTESAATASRMMKTQEAYLTKLIDQRIENVAPRKIELSDGSKKVELPAGIRHKLFEVALKAVKCGPVALIGPAGAGKTTLAIQIAEAMGIQFAFTGAIASEYKLMGFIDAQGRTVRTAFRDVYEKGGLFLFDEIDGSVPQAVLAFNNAIANDHCDFPDGNVKKHPDFYVMAAANTYWTGADRVYVGRNQLDGASLDRFIFMTVEYDEDLEALLTDNKDWLEHVQFAREAVAALKLRHIISPRATVYGTKLLDMKLSFKQAEMMTIFKGMPAEDVKRTKLKMKELATKGKEVGEVKKEKEAA